MLRQDVRYCLDTEHAYTGISNGRDRIPRLEMIGLLANLAPLISDANLTKKLHSSVLRCLRLQI